MSSWEEFVSDVNSEGRARACMFRWLLPPIELGGANADLKLVSTNLPGNEVEELVTHWQGLVYRCGGSRRYNDWTTTIMCNNSAASSIRFRFELWLNEINFVQIFSHTYNPPNLTSGGYYRPQTLVMLDDEGSITHQITLVDSWPKSVGDISLDRSSSDFATFDVTFAYNYSFFTPL